MIWKQGDEALDAAGSLAEPVRRRLLALVMQSTDPVGRDEAAAAIDITRSLAGYHLDRLVDEGLLHTTYARRSGRRGPGAGRPAKLYQAAPVEVTVQMPPRDDALLADLLAAAVEADNSGRARRALRRVTRAAGRALGASAVGASGGLVAALAARGYAPVETAEGIRLRNCPFHHLVADHAELVCGLNKDLLVAATHAAGGEFKARLAPQPGRCCVVLESVGPRV